LCAVCSRVWRCWGVWTGAAANQGAAAAGVAFYSERTVVHLGATRVIPFAIEPAPAEDLTLDAVVTADDGTEPALEVIRPPRVLTSAVRWVSVVDPLAEGAVMIASEAEDQQHTPRPERYNDKPLGLATDERASGKR